MSLFNPLIPTGTINLDTDYKNIQNNMQQLDTSFAVDHYAFSNNTANNGKHTHVQLPAGADFAAVAGQGTAYAKSTGIGSGEHLFWRYANPAIPPLQITNNLISPTTNPGIIPLMGGLVMQYGKGTTTGTNTPITFSSGGFFAGGVASSPYSVICTPIQVPSASNFGITNVTSTGFNYLRVSVVDYNFFWVAIGPFN